MRVLSSPWKPMASPCRLDKFPPPLMRFLRSNVGSKSRGKSRAKYPLFLRRNKKAITTTSSSSAIEVTQEPSSPKVTCIGQVRVTRSKSKSNSKKPRNNKCSCYCFDKQKPRLKNWKIPDCKKWVLFFNCRSVRVRTDSSKFGSNRFEEKEETENEEQTEREKWRLTCMEELTSTSTTTATAITAVMTAKMTAEMTAAPPKNALLLTRCRSAPYRSSSLACHFWGSPLRNKEEAEEQTNSALGIEHRDSISSNSRRDRDSGSKKEEDDLGICAEIEDYYSNEVKKRSIEYEEGEGGFSRPFMLMRCKSEPIRRDFEKFDSENCDLWRHTSLGKRNTQ